MNIGIDIDGVLTNYEREVLDLGTKMSVEENWPIININQVEYDETKALGWKEEQAIMFWNRYLVKYFTETPVRTFATEVLEKLHDEGNKIYIITARNNYRITERILWKSTRNNKTMVK